MKNEVKAYPEKKLWGLIKSILKYPFKVSGMYSGYSKGLSDLVSVKNEPALRSKEDQYFRNIQNKNAKFVWGFIYSPILIGALISLFMAYSHKPRYQEYATRLALPIVEERFVRKVTLYIDKAWYSVRGQPISVEDITPFVIGYILSILGARFCSKNPTFEIQNEIQRRFIGLGCTDIDGKPWKVIWTPEALLIVSFGRDPNQLHGDAKFWASINFPPSIPKQSKKDMNKFVVQRKYELMSNMTISLEGMKDENE